MGTQHHVSEPFLQTETTFFTSDKEVISKWGLLLKECENLLEEQILPFEELDPI